MSYSRWSNSVWYSFWNSSGGSSRDTQVLSLWFSHTETLKDWTYPEVLAILNLNQYELGKKWQEVYPGALGKETLEGVRYMREFIQDVDEEFEEGFRK